MTHAPDPSTMPGGDRGAAPDQSPALDQSPAFDQTSALGQSTAHGQSTAPDQSTAPHQSTGSDQSTAAAVANTAKDATGQVAGTVAEQAKSVTADAGHELRDLLDQARSQLREQTSAQQHKVVGGMRSLVDEMRSMADNGGQSGPATQMVRQTSQFVHQAADWLDKREPGDLIEELRDLGRRKPGGFLAGAVLAGVLAGRLTRGTIAAKSADTDDTPGAPTPADSIPAVQPEIAESVRPDVPAPGGAPIRTSPALADPLMPLPEPPVLTGQPGYGTTNGPGARP